MTRLAVKTGSLNILLFKQLRRLFYRQASSELFGVITNIRVYNIHIIYIYFSVGETEYINVKINEKQK